MAYSILKRGTFCALLVLLCFITSCQSDIKIAEVEKPTPIDPVTINKTHFTLIDSYRNIQKGKTIASIYAVSTDIEDASQMENFALNIPKTDEKYLFIYFLEKSDSTANLSMDGVLLNQKYRSLCKGIYEKTPSSQSFTMSPFKS